MYEQIKTYLERPVYIRPPDELNLPETMELKVQKTVYGIPETDLHLDLTCMKHHIEKLGITRELNDP